MYARSSEGFADRAEEQYHEVLSIDPTHEITLSRLEELYRAARRWADVAGILERRTSGLLERLPACHVDPGQAERVQRVQRAARVDEVQVAIGGTILAGQHPLRQPVGPRDAGGVLVDVEVAVEMGVELGPGASDALAVALAQLDLVPVHLHHQVRHQLVQRVRGQGEGDREPAGGDDLRLEDVRAERDEDRPAEALRNDEGRHRRDRTE